MRYTSYVASARLGLVALCGILSASTAQPTSPGHLQGEFSVQATEHCIHSSGFGPPPVMEALGPTVLENTTLQGVLILRADGSGEFTGRSASITTSSIGSPMQQSTLRCPVIYSIDREGVLRLDRACKGTVVRGSLSVGGQVWSTSSVQLDGRFHAATGSLQLTDSALEIETLTSFHGARTPRVCMRAWSAVRTGRGT